MRNDLFHEIHRAVELLKHREREEHTHIVSHLDADGLCACGIMSQALQQEGLRPTITILPQLSERTIQELAEREESTIIFLDAGSSHLSLLEKYLTKQNVIVIDHHHIEGVPKRILLVNPTRTGYDGSRDVCSATLAYLVARALNPVHRRLAPLAIVGVVADAQEKLGIVGLNKEALDDALNAGLLTIVRDLRLHGLQTKALVPLLVKSYDLKIPGVTGNEEGARALLRELGISERDEEHRLRTYTRLSNEERERLTKRVSELLPGRDDLFVNHYVLVKEPPGQFRDAHEFATILNACGRLGQSELGLAMISGESEARARAPKIQHEYARALNAAHRWYQRAREPEVFRDDGLILMNAKDRVLPSLIGTLCSIIARGGEVPPGTIVLALARTTDGLTKISARVAGYAQAVNLRKTLEDLVRPLGGESGGHTQAAGALIPTEDEERFILRARELFSRHRGAVRASS